MVLNIQTDVKILHHLNFHLALYIFLFQIIENPNIPKTNKVRLFNEHTLNHVIKLYNWKGPMRKKKFGKRKLGEEPQPLAFVCIIMLLNNLCIVYKKMY